MQSTLVEYYVKKYFVGTTRQGWLVTLRVWDRFLGTDGVSKTDEFSEKFQTAFFGKSYCGFRDKIATKVRMFIMVGLLCVI